ncbi:glycosyltransferase [Bacillus sp. sid0103]|uniref:glycosyltransferase family 2 protein n=1 Tax=Bacillus sp. sid0103 TaxID=2856337 RepID=UPI001C482505|nr:glycosyltransferase [Bacillus sp. sid0103]MBV7504077.1 glycosyltransferase [Bacillus sp. sid0103]
MVTVVTSTIRESMLERVIENFMRQNLQEKELIIILNKNDLKLESLAWPNIKVFRLDEEKTLGECLNFGVMQASYGVIAKFDDDDYYSPSYLDNALRLLKETGAEVIGKAGIFVYFKKDKLLTVFRPRMNSFFLKNKRVFLAGGSLVFNKEVLEKVQFKALNSGEDVQFQKDCLDRKISLYSGSVHDYVLIRYLEGHQHSWQVLDETFQKQCKRIAVTDSFEEYVWEGGRTL